MHYLRGLKVAKPPISVNVLLDTWLGTSLDICRSPRPRKKSPNPNLDACLQTCIGTCQETCSAPTLSTTLSVPGSKKNRLPRQLPEAHA